MFNTSPDKPPRQVSVPSLIAWLSVCLLAASWGRTIDEHWQHYWTIAGTFGLVAAVGLGSVEKVRRFRNEWIREQAARTLVDGRLAQLNEHNAAHATIKNAITELAEYVAAVHQMRGFRPAQIKDPLTLSNYPLEVIPIDEDCENFEIVSARSIPGSLRKITPSTAIFEYGQPFSERVAMLAFKLEKDRKLCFVVDVMCTNKSTTGFSSSGAIMAVGVPEQQDSVSALAKTYSA